jgi:DNA-binding CsgD family transcriptional regulator
MLASGIPFALIDPVANSYLQANDEYAALLGLDSSEMRGLSQFRVHPPEMTQAIDVMNKAYLRGLEATRGEGPALRPTGGVVELKGWARRVDGIQARRLLIASAVEAGNGSLVDERSWIARAPHAFGLREDSLELDEYPDGRADALEQHLWRIGIEVRAAGLLPQMDPPTSEDIIHRFDELSPRQREIVAKLLAGRRVAQIAQDMYLTPSTVRNHLSSAFRKFGVHSQIELISALKSLGGNRK